jgi:alpha-glucosidase
VIPEAPQLTVPDKGYSPVGGARVRAVLPCGVVLETHDGLVEVTVLADGMFRIGYFPAGRPIAYESGAVDPSFVADDAEVTLDQQRNAVVLSCPDTPNTGFRCRIDLSPLRVSLEDAEGRMLAEDDPVRGMGVGSHGPNQSLVGPPMRLYKRRRPSERYYACGQRTGRLDKTNTFQIFWNIDPPLGHGPDSNNMYVSIPLLLSVDAERDGQAWGLFLDWPGRVEFDLAKTDPELADLAQEGGDLVYYLFVAASWEGVVQRFTRLTGRTPMPPLWSLGYGQSRYSYMSREELLGVAHGLRRRRIPCDAVYLDIDYMDGYRVFTWDPERFRDPADTIRRLHEMGMRLVTILDPGVKVDERYAPYRELHQSGQTIRTDDGDEYHNAVWPGLCAFPDFSAERARGWWVEKLRALTDPGVDGIWCDMNEPALFVPLRATAPPDTVQLGDDRPRFHAAVHNLYGSQMAQATRDGLVRLRPEVRPMVISRAGYAGLQRQALHWTGDNSSWWEHLSMSVPQMLNLGFSGLSWIGADIGGFADDSNGELLTRWFELGIAYPFCRNHSAKGTVAQEPWAFGEPYESAIRRLLELRMRLLPYIYALFRRCHECGDPILRPMPGFGVDLDATAASETELLLGDALLFAPITQPGTAYRYVYLPRGDWTHWWTGTNHRGPAHILAHAPLGEPAIFARANTAIPLWPVQQHVDEIDSPDLTLLVHTVADGAGHTTTLYDDAGDGYADTRGEYSRRDVTVSPGATLLVTLGPVEGSLRLERTIHLDIRGLAVSERAIRASIPDAQVRTHEDGVIVGFTDRPETVRIELDTATR